MVIKEVDIKRKWSMPNKWTFDILPIKDLLFEELKGIEKELIVDPYAGKNGSKYAYHTNDLAEGGMDALDYLKKFPKESFQAILLDPPYSLRQVSEHYKKAGLKITGWHTSSGYNSKLKDQAARILRKGGKVICFGWNSMGLGKNRGFEMQKILLVPHGGSKNDTIVTVEIKRTKKKIK